MKRVILVVLLLGLCSHPVGAVDFSDYRRDVDLYRTAYSAFDVKKGSFANSPTFAAEEELITAARSMLLSRADVWISYWQLLGSQVATLTQMQKSNQDTIQENLMTEVKIVQKHKERLVAAKTRAELLEEAKILNAQFEKYQSLAFSVNAELITNKLLQATTLLLRFNRDLTDRVGQQLLVEAEKTSKLRGLSVNAERIDQLINGLSAARARLVENTIYASSESFSKITQEVGPLYPQMNQLLQTTIELSKGVEW